MKKLLTLLLAIASFATMNAQVTFTGQYRARGEMRNGFKAPIMENTEPAAFVEHRARLIVGYKKDKVGFKASIQDVRIWGETGQINKSDQLLSAHEAYGDYYATDKSTFRIGRQEMIYDDHRFIGSLDWAMQGRSFDALRYMHKGDGFDFDAMVSWNQVGYGDGAPEPANLTGNYYETKNGGGVENTRIFNLELPKSQQMVYFKKTFDAGSIGIMIENDIYNSSPDTAYSNFTVGLSPKFAVGALKFGGQFFYTGGAIDKGLTAAGQEYKTELSGYMFNLFIQAPKVTGAPLLGIDYLSGDDETTSEVEGWSPKYGTNHKFYGFMDYFYVGNGHGGGNERSAGLVDIYLKTAFKFGEKSSLAGHLHYFMSAQERTYMGEAYDGSLGTELDLVYTRKLAKELSLQVGYSHMFGISETMKVLKGMAPDASTQGMQSWAWLQVSFSPKFL